MIAQYEPWQGRLPNEPLDHFGSRAITFVLGHVLLDDMTDDDLDAADRAARIGMTAKTISPSALEVLSSAVHRIQVLLKARRIASQQPISAPAGREKDNIGPMAPVLDRPLVQPPSGSKVEVQF